jgi:hypothetical protein
MSLGKKKEKLMETTYSVSKEDGRYLLQHRSGDCKIGLTTIWAQDETELLSVLNMLRVPGAKIDTLLQALRLGQISATVTFDAKVREPIT